MLQEQPHSARQQNGSVATAAYAYQHGKGKVVDRLAAKEENRHNGKQGSNRRIHRTGQSGENTVIDHLRNGFTPPMYLQVSRIRSKITMVPLTEYPTTVNKAAIKVESTSNCISENQLRVTETSMIKAMIAATAKFH